MANNHSSVCQAIKKNIALHLKENIDMNVQDNTKR